MKKLLTCIILISFGFSEFDLFKLNREVNIDQKYDDFMKKNKIEDRPVIYKSNKFAYPYIEWDKKTFYYTNFLKESKHVMIHFDSNDWLHEYRTMSRDMENLYKDYVTLKNLHREIKLEYHVIVNQNKKLKDIIS